MASVYDNKATVVLNEYKLAENLRSQMTLTENEEWTIDKFSNKFKIVIIRLELNEMEFDLIGVNASIANTFRRLIISDVPSMAIEKVHIINNTCIIQDEVLAHRLGLIPLKADPFLFDFKSDSSAESIEQDSLEFSLKVKCSYNKDATKNSSRVEDMYKHNNIYAKHIKWQPIGDQRDKFKEKDVGPIHDDILIAKLRPGHELDLKLIAVKGVGKDHAKFSPVATAFYRLLPDIQLTRAVEGEAAERLQKCFSPGVINLRQDEKRGHSKIAEVTNSRYDMGSRNVFRYEDLKDAVVMSKIQDHFIFTIESIGAIEPTRIFIEAVKILKTKCVNLLDELNNS